MKNKNSNDKRIEENEKKTIYLEFLGLPGGGKTTTARALKKELEKQGQDVLYFPDYWEKSMKNNFDSLGKFKKCALPVIYSLRDPRAWRIAILYILVFFENFMVLIKNQSICDNINAFKRMGLFNFIFYKDNKFSQQIKTKQIDFFIEDDGLLKGLIQSGCRKYFAKQLLKNLMVTQGRIMWHKKVFIYFKEDNTRLLIDRIKSDKNREFSNFWTTNNKDRLTSYFQDRKISYSKLTERIKAIAAEYSNLYFLELSASDQVNNNINKIQVYLETLKTLINEK